MLGEGRGEALAAALCPLHPKSHGEKPRLGNEHPWIMWPHKSMEQMSIDEGTEGIVDEGNCEGVLEGVRGESHGIEMEKSRIVLI
jgi:hypothetical protein